MNNQELHTIAPTLMKMKRESCFVVPEHYFETLPTQVEYLLLLKKQEAFIVPEGYFDMLPQRVAAQITETPKMVFDAPQDYFENLPQLIQQRIYEDEQSKKWFAWKPTYTYALATITACVVLFFGVKLFFNDKQIKPIANVLKPTVNDTSNQVAVVNTNAGLQIKVSDNTQKQILQHIHESELQNIDEAILLEELANANEEPNIKTEKTNEQIQDFLIENNIDESILIDAVN
jgi:hypothetical protein